MKQIRGLFIAIFLILLTIYLNIRNKMTIESKLRGGLALTIIGLIIVQFFYFENVRKFEEYKVTTTNQIDSLVDTQFQLNVEIGRHEMTREEILSKYPKVKKEYEEYYEHQTE